MSTFEISSKHSSPLCGRSMRDYCEYWPKRTACTGVLGGRAVIARRSSQNLERPNWPGKTVTQSESTCSPNQVKRYRACMVTTWMGDRYVPCFQRSLDPRFLRSQDLCTYTHVKDHTGSPYQSGMDYENTKTTQHALKRVTASESARERGIALHKKRSVIITLIIWLHWPKRNFYRVMHD